MPKADERNGDDLGPGGRRFTNSRMFQWGVAGLIGLTGGGGSGYLLTGESAQELRDLHDKYILLEQRFEIQQENFRELNAIKEANMDSRLERMENDIKSILNKLDK